MNWNGLNRLLLGGVLCGALLTAGKIHAEEESSQVLTAVSSTTISGYVDTEVSFGSITMTLSNVRVREYYSPTDYLFRLLRESRGSIPLHPDTRRQRLAEIIAAAQLDNSGLDAPLASSGTTDTTLAEINDSPYPLFSGGADTFFAPSGAPNSIVQLPTSIPEPSAIALFLGGAGLLAFRMRRRS